VVLVHTSAVYEGEFVIVVQLVWSAYAIGNPEIFSKVFNARYRWLSVV
jgi:hypothetical protein